MSETNHVKLDFETLPDVAAGTCSGELSILDLKAAAATMIEGLEKHPTPPRHMLWDLTAAKLDLDAVEVQRLVEFVGARAGEPRGRTAYVADADLAFGLMRVYQAYRSEHDDQISVFRDRKEAIDWLGAG